MELTEQQAVRLAEWCGLTIVDHVVWVRHPGEQLFLNGMWVQRATLPAYFHSPDGWTRLLEKMQEERDAECQRLVADSKRDGWWIVLLDEILGSLKGHNINADAVIQAALKVMEAGEAKGVKG